MRVTAGMVARVRALAEPHWSPDGRWLAYLESFDGRGDVMMVPADGGPARRLTADPGAQPTASYGGGILNWLDAETVIFVAPDGQLHALSVARRPDAPAHPPLGPGLQRRPRVRTAADRLHGHFEDRSADRRRRSDGRRVAPPGLARGRLRLRPVLVSGRLAGLAGVERPRHGLGRQPDLAADAGRRA